LSGANINIATDLGKTPLMLAAQKNRLDIVALLLKKGADINAIDKHSLNAMNYALKSNKINNVDLISQIKSNPFLMLEYNQSGLLKSFVDSIPTAVNWQNENGVSLKSLMSAQKSEKTIPKRKTNIQIKRSIEIPDVENRKLEANTRPYIAPLNPTKKMLSSPLDTCIKNERTNERKENRNKPSNPICLLIFLIQPFDLTRTELKLEAETDR
jgi:ankyrin repeat protein